MTFNIFSVRSDVLTEFSDVILEYSINLIKLSLLSEDPIPFILPCLGEAEATGTEVAVFKLPGLTFAIKPKRRFVTSTFLFCLSVAEIN